MPTEKQPASSHPVISRSIEDLLTPGVIVEVTAEEAERYGAFEEIALTEEEAWESNMDLDMDPPAEEAGALQNQKTEDD